MNPSFRFSSSFFLFLVAIWMCVQFYTVRRWLNEDQLWQHEMKSYYGYLPALFVLHDVGFEKTEMTPENQTRYYHPKPAPVRGHVMKTTMGVAIMQVPFFLTAHVISLLGNDPEDGFSLPYKILAVLAGMFYTLLGLFFVRKSVLYFFSDGVCSVVLMTLFVGTNLYYYTFYEPAMSHLYSFALVAAFVYYTIAWHRNPKNWHLLLVGVLVGLMTLIRPVNACLVLFFALYRDANQASLKAKFGLLFSKWKILLLAFFLFLLTLAPQLIYWKYLTGSWLYYSYGEEGFFWLKPKIALGLFSYQKGWLVWTPIMWFAVLGMLLYAFNKDQRRLFLPIVSSISIYIYVIFCWWCWWYGGGFGSRPMIDVMPILAIPLAFFYQRVSSVKFLAYPALGLAFFFLSLNQFQIHQYVVGKLHWAGTSKKVYWALFLNDYPKEDYGPYIQEPDIEKAIKGESGLD